MKLTSRSSVSAGIIALALIFLTSPLHATDRKSSSSDDRRVQDYKRKIAEINQRVAATEKALGQAAAGYKAQVARKEKELKDLQEQYQARAESAKKAIGELRKDQAELAKALSNYEKALKEKQTAEANRKRDEAKKKAAEDAK